MPFVGPDEKALEKCPTVPLENLRNGNSFCWNSVFYLWFGPDVQLPNPDASWMDSFPLFTSIIFINNRRLHDTKPILLKLAARHSIRGDFDGFPFSLCKRR